MKKGERKKVMVFGVFDKFHDGHREFLKQASCLGDELFVVVASDEMVLSVKGKSPAFAFQDRATKVQSAMPEAQILKSDATPGTWDVIKNIKPNMIALGYDQETIEAALKEKIKDFSFTFEIKKLDPHKPDIFHTSLLT